jgi:hypothetical protein
MSFIVLWALAALSGIGGDPAAPPPVYADSRLAESSTAYDPDTGNPTGGTAAAYPTVNAAIAAAPAGGTVYVMPGTYRENSAGTCYFVTKRVNVWGYTGNPAAVTLTYPPGNPPGSYSTGLGHVVHSGPGGRLDLRHVTIIGTLDEPPATLHTTNRDVDCSIWVDGGLTMRNCVVLKSGHAGIKFQVTEAAVDVQGCVFSQGGRSLFDHGCYLHGWAGDGSRCRFVGNRFEGFVGYGIHAYDRPQRLDVVGNACVGNGMGGVVAGGTNCVYALNTCYGNGWQDKSMAGLVVWSTARNCTFYGNLLWGNASNTLDRAYDLKVLVGAANNAVSKNWYASAQFDGGLDPSGWGAATDVVGTDPLFVSSAGVRALDARLRATSPAAAAPGGTPPPLASQLDPATLAVVSGAAAYGAFAPGVTPEYTLTGPFRGSRGSASKTFTVTRGGSGPAVTYTPHRAGPAGTFSPSTVALASGAGRFTFTPSATGSATVSTANSGSQADPPPLGYDSFAVPKLVSATLAADGVTLSLAFDQVVFGYVGFKLHATGGVTGLNYASGGGSDTLVFTTGRTVLKTETLTLDFDASTGVCQAGYNYPLATVTDLSVTNSSSQTGGGTLAKLFTSYWTLDGVSGAALVDKVSASGNNLTANNNPTASAGKVTANAMHFTAARSHTASCTLNNLGSGNYDYYVCAWVWLDSKPDEATIVTNQYPGFILRYRAASDRFEFFYGGSSWVQADKFGSPSVGRWYFVEAWFDSTAKTLNIAVNGQATPDAKAMAGSPGAGSGLTIGGRGTTNHFDGRIAGVGIIKGSLPNGTDRASLWNVGAGANPFR